MSTAADVPITGLSGHAGTFASINRVLMTRIADRFDPEYPWIDTKFDIATGRDFPFGDELRGRNAVYTWIQGRGLEALALHARWLENGGLGKEAACLDGIIAVVRESLERVVKNAPGPLPFVLNDADRTAGGNTENETRLNRSESALSLGDVFAARGLFCAAERLGRDTAAERQYCRETVDGAFDGRVINNQPALDPNNAVDPMPGRHTHAPFMLGIGTMNLLWRSTGDSAFLHRGLDCVRHILAHHVNVPGKWPGLPEWAFTEFVDEDGNPYPDTDGRILSDSGHALEVVGLSAVLIEDLPGDEAASLYGDLLRVLSANFDIGYRARPGGIVKSVDLKNQSIINPTFPWWSLPETIRASLAIAAAASLNEDRTLCLGIYRKCRRDYFRNYISPAGGMAGIQNLDASGDVSDVIPAVPDVDPGYHTGLAFLDSIRYLRKLKTEEQT